MESAALPVSPATTPPATAGTALEPRLYIDPELLESEQLLIFERTWQLAGHVASLPKPGGYLTALAGTQPVLVVRDEDNQLRAFKNVCHHRGSRLLSGSGQCKAAIRCRYHGWTYRLDGSLIGVPEGLSFEEKIDKRKSDYSGARRGDVRAGVRKPRSRRDAARGPRRRSATATHARPDRDAGVIRAGTGKQPANWKVVADNYLEGYHIQSRTQA